MMGRTKRLRMQRRRLSQKRPFTICHDQNIVELCLWMKNYQWKPVSCLLAAAFPDTGRGLMTMKNLAPGEMIVQIPEALLLTRETALKQMSLQKHETFSTAEILTAFLAHLQVSHPCGEYQKYLESLPMTFTNAALCLPEELELLPRFIRDIVLTSKANLEGKYKKLSEVCQQQLDLHLERDLFIWAWFCVNTRAVYFKDSESSGNGENNLALAPYLDMLNHSCEAKVDAGYNPSKKCYEIRTLVPYKKFNQVFINYGPHDNLKLWVEYGFVIEGNLHNYIPISVQEISQILAKEVTLKKQNLLNSTDFQRGIFCTATGLSWNLQLTLIILKLNDFQLENINSIYEIEDAFPEVVINDLASHLLQCKIDELNISLNKMSSNEKSSASFKFALVLVKDLINLLTSALQSTCLP